MSDSEKRIETPMLKAYLSQLPSLPAHVPTVPHWLTMVLLVAIVGARVGHLIPLYAAITGAVVVFFIPQILASFTTPKNESERVDQVFFDKTKRLRGLAAEGSLRKQVPPRVLTALESCTSAYVASQTRLTSEGIGHNSLEHENLENCMRGALLATAPLVRREDQGRKEWEALCENGAVIGAVVDAIQAQEEKMLGPSSALSERLMALKELDGISVERTRLSEF